MSRHRTQALIIDDEANARENLSGLIGKYCPGVEIVGEASGIQDGIDLIKEKSPELVFLDIRLSDNTGFQMLEMLDWHDFGVIFTTAYDNYAIRAIKFSAVDYLLKPIDYRELKEAVKKFIDRSVLERKVFQLEILIENLSKDSAFRRLGINMDGKTEIIVVKEILRLQAESNYTRIYLSTGESIVVTKTLVEFEELLEGIGFLRVHKTHIVNLGFVKTLEKKGDWKLILEGNCPIPVSRRRRRFVSDQLTKRQ